jgi:DHA3 family macrolide efflux protein-like MFS transporter
MSWKRKFTIIWAGKSVSVFTSSVLQMALLWHLAIETTSAAVLSLAAAAAFLPQALFGTVAGALVDRWSRKAAMIGADLYIAAVGAALAVYALFAAPPIWVIMAVLFLRSFGTAFHTPAISATTPLIVPPEYLTKVAGYVQTLQTIGFIAGTSVAAVLFPLWGMAGMVAMDVVGAIIASIAVAMVKIPQPKVDVGATVPGRPRPRLFAQIPAQISEAFKVIKSHKGIFALMWIAFAFMLVYSPINALFPLMSMDYFGGTTTHAAAAEVVFAIGMMGGGLALGIWGGFKNRATSMIFAIALMGAALGIAGLLPIGGFVIFAALSLFMGLSVPFYTGPHMALMQQKIPPEYLGRVFGMYGSLMSAAMLLGLVASGALADSTGINIWFLICGIIISILAIVAVMIPSVRHIDKPQPDIKGDV